MNRRWLSVVLLLGATIALGARPSFQEHAAVQESLSRVHPRMRARWLRAHGLDDSYYTTFHRPENSGLLCVGRWPWGPSWELAGRDTFLYLGSGSGVRILSIADSVHPRMLGQINARSLVSQVVVQDSLLFVACGSWGAQIYSVADPSNPRELGSMDAVISDVCVKDTFCYAVGGDRFRIYDVSDPTLPVEMGAASDNGDAIVFANGHTYVGGAGPLNVYNVSDPYHPSLVNSLGGPTYDMYVRRNLLFCTWKASPTRFSILNVNDPLNITEVSGLSGYAGEGVCANDSFALVSCIRDHVGLFVVDVSDSTRPLVRDSINPEGIVEWQPYAPSPSSYGYLADYHGGLVTLDLHDPDSISEAWSGYKAHSAVDISIDGQRAYIANDLSGLQIVDVADPTNPVLLGIFDTVGTRQTFTTQARDSFAFIGWWGNNRRFLRVLDVIDPTSPVFAAEESCFNPPQDIILRDTFIYAAEPYEFEVFNVARPREPERMGSCELPLESYDLDVEGSIAYVANILSLQMVNVARPDSPYVVGTWSGKTAGVDVVDTVAYAGSIDYFLASLNVKNPAAPQEIDTLNLGDAPTDVRVVGSRAYVSGGSNWVKVVDVSDPAALKLVGTWSGPGWVRRIEYAAPYLYAACSEAGVCVLESVAVGVGEQRAGGSWSAGLSFAPNPTRGRVDVGLPVGVEGRCEWEVCNVAGRVVNAGCWKTASQTSSLNLVSEPAGVYVVTCKTRAGTGRGRIVKF